MGVVKWDSEDGATSEERSTIKLSLPAVGSALCGRYQIKKRIGQGAAAVVYEALDTILKVPVALKVLKAKSVENDRAVEGIDIDLRNEAIAAMRLSHPHILRVFNYEQDPPWEFLVMECVHGEDSRKHRQRAPQGYLPVDQTVRIGLQCLHGLHYAHGLGVVHHDIKPSNILLTPTGDAKLCDFGLARLKTTRWRQGVVAGTPGFLSPERLTGQAGDFRSDLFSMGATLYALTNGCAPFGVDPLRVYRSVMSGELPARGHLPEAVFAVIARAFAARPTDRFRDAREMRAALVHSCELAHVPVPWETGTNSWNPVPADSAAPPPLPPEFRAKPPARHESYEEHDEEHNDLEIDVNFDQELGFEPEEYSESLDTMALVASRTFTSKYGGKRAPVEAFFIDICPVTNAEYSGFVSETGHMPPPQWSGWEPPPELATHPVVGVTHEDACTYARWAGKRLPTSLEWEAACSSPDGRSYPWGNDWALEHCHCDQESTGPVGSNPSGASHDGCLDLVGNVWEWTTRVAGDEPEDLEREWAYGGSYRHSGQSGDMVARNAVSKGNDYDYLGFRCVKAVAS